MGFFDKLAQGAEKFTDMAENSLKLKCANASDSELKNMLYNTSTQMGNKIIQEELQKRGL